MLMYSAVDQLVIVWTNMERRSLAQGHPLYLANQSAKNHVRLTSYYIHYHITVHKHAEHSHCFGNKKFNSDFEAFWAINFRTGLTGKKNSKEAN